MAVRIGEQFNTARKCTEERVKGRQRPPYPKRKKELSGGTEKGEGNAGRADHLSGMRSATGEGAVWSAREQHRTLVPEMQEQLYPAD